MGKYQMKYPMKPNSEREANGRVSMKGAFDMCNDAFFDGFMAGIKFVLEMENLKSECFDIGKILNIKKAD